MYESAKNPYTLQFGSEPGQIITREMQGEQIIETFSAERPPQQTYMITGVRGSGKTVFMGAIVEHFQKRKDWVCVNLSTGQDMLTGLISKMGNRQELARQFKAASINLSLFGVGVSISGSLPLSDPETALEKMLANMKEHGQRLLIAVDEITNTAEIKKFCSSFQLFVREKLPVFLIMTGLYENIESLRNAPDMTFLYRAERVVMEPLNLMTIADHYQQTFSLERENALQMAALTKGYSFAFQVLGYYTWAHKGKYEEAREDFYQRLSEYSYIKIWTSASEKDRQVMLAMANAKTNRIQDIREELGWQAGQFSPYRERLIRRGLAVSSSYGCLDFTLPDFGRFVVEYHLLLTAE